MNMFLENGRNIKSYQFGARPIKDPYERLCKYQRAGNSNYIMKETKHSDNVHALCAEYYYPITWI